MPVDNYPALEVDVEALAGLADAFRELGEAVDALGSAVGPVRAALERAAATGLGTAALDGALSGPAAPLTAARAAGVIRHQLRDAVGELREFSAERKALGAGLAEDAEKLLAIRQAYLEAEQQLLEDAGDHHREGGSGDGGGGSGGDGDGSGGSDPHPATTPLAAIPAGDISYADKGGWRSGEAASRAYTEAALDRLGIVDPAARAAWTRGMLVLIRRESSYNAGSQQVNLTDSNAQGAPAPDGAPAGSSRGICQTIPSVFARYHAPGTSASIYDPVANTAAAINYILDRYGVAEDGSDLAEKVQQAAPDRPPHGF